MRTGNLSATNMMMCSKWKLEENRFLYFANLDLENDREGLSEVEPIYLVCCAQA